MEKKAAMATFLKSSPTHHETGSSYWRSSSYGRGNGDD
jgi:hypothetical protein